MVGSKELLQITLPAQRSADSDDESLRTEDFTPENAQNRCAPWNSHTVQLKEAAVFRGPLVSPQPVFSGPTASSARPVGGVALAEAVSKGAAAGLGLPTKPAVPGIIMSTAAPGAMPTAICFVIPSVIPSVGFVDPPQPTRDAVVAAAAAAAAAAGPAAAAAAATAAPAATPVIAPKAPAPSFSPEVPAAASSSEAASRPSIKKQAWSQEEDEKLLAIVTEQGPSCWSQIAVSLPGRLGKQCRERWHNHLAPDVKKDDFSEEEDRTIIEAVAKHGTKWSLIVKLVPGRTDNSIKNRWNSAARRLNRMQRRQDVDEMASVGLDPTVGDVTSLDSQVLARHLLKTGLDPRVPRAKRKLAVDTNAAAGKRAAPCKDGPSMNGLEMLCELTTTTSATATEAQGACDGAAPSAEDKRSTAVAHQDVAAMLLSLGQGQDDSASALLAMSR